MWQAHRALVQQGLAEQRFELARQLAGSVLYEFHDGIRDLQGSLKVQQLVLTRSLEYLDKLAATSRATPALQRDLANGYERVAELAGRPGSSNLGRDQYAIQSLRKALALRRQVLAADPRSVELRRELARTHREFVNLDDLSAPEMVEHAAAATSLVEGLLRDAPTDTRIRNDLSISEYGMGTSLVRQSRYAEAIPYFRKALVHASDAEPANVALYHKHLGAVLIKTDDLKGALSEYEAAVGR
jgi:tetratricopeptide (TPR) repeat protein